MRIGCGKHVVPHGVAQLLVLVGAETLLYILGVILLLTDAHALRCAPALTQHECHELCIVPESCLGKLHGDLVVLERALYVFPMIGQTAREVAVRL